MISKKTKIALGVSALVILGILLYFMYLFLNSSNATAMMIPVMLVLGLILGGIIVFLALKNSKPEAPVITENAHTIAESMRKVFKVVTAEGHFNEIYNYEESSKIFGFVPSKKKALVIVQAKVLVGYDFEKFKWEVDEQGHKVNLLYFPPPEILSTETDYKYYNIEEQFFNLFSKDDLSKIQQNSKQLVIDAAKRSHLPEVAAEQMRMLLTELLQSKNFTLENPEKISETRNKIEFKPT